MTKRLALVVCAALSACGGGAAVPNGTQTSAKATRSTRTTASVPQTYAGAPSKKVLYVSDIYTDVVDVYDYAKSRQIGVIRGFNQPSGECVDKQGDVWVTEYEGYQVFEFAHGNLRPIKVFRTNGNAMGCSVDPVTGNLAIGSEDSKQNAWGDIQVFPRGSGSPKSYYSYPGSEGCPYPQAPGYDDKGNLFFEAEWGKSGWRLCELPAGSSSIVRAPIEKSKIFKTLDHPGSVMWDGKYITFEDYRNDASQSSVIYQATSSGSQLAVVGSTTLAASCHSANVAQPFIVGARNLGNHTQGTVVIGGNVGCYPLFGYWHYPAGGAPFRAKPEPTEVGGAVVSLAVP